MSTKEFLSQVESARISEVRAKASLAQAKDDTFFRVGSSFVNSAINVGAQNLRGNIQTDLDVATSTSENSGQLNDKIAEIKNKYSPVAIGLVANDLVKQANASGELLDFTASKKRQELKEKELMEQINQLRIVAPNANSFQTAANNLIRQFETTTQSPLSEGARSKIDIGIANATQALNIKNEETNAALATKIAKQEVNNIITNPRATTEDIRKTYDSVLSTLNDAVQDSPVVARDYLFQMLRNSTDPAQIESFKDVLDPDQLNVLQNNALANQQKLLTTTKNNVAQSEKEMDSQVLSVGGYVPVYQFQNKDLAEKNEFNKGKNFDKLNAQQIIQSPTTDLKQVGYLNEYANNYIRDFAEDFPQAMVSRGVAAEYEFKPIFLPEIKDGEVQGSLDRSLQSIDARLQYLKRAQSYYSDPSLSNIFSADEKSRFLSFFQDVRPYDKYELFTSTGDLIKNQGLDVGILDTMFGDRPSSERFSLWYNFRNIDPNLSYQSFAGYETFKQTSDSYQKEANTNYNAINISFGRDLNNVAISEETYDFLKKVTLGQSVLEGRKNTTADLYRVFNQYFRLNTKFGLSYVTYNYPNLTDGDIRRRFDSLRTDYFPKSQQEFLKGRDIAFSTTSDLNNMLVYYRNDAGVFEPITLDNKTPFSMKLPSVLQSHK